MKQTKDVVLLGYGQHAISIISTIQHLDIEMVGYVDASEKLNDTFSLKRLGNDENYLNAINYSAFHICAIGDNQLRETVQREYENRGAKFINIIHPTACIEESVVLGQGVFIGAFAYVNGLVKVGDGCIVNNHVNIDHGCQIGQFCHLGPSSALSGDVEVGERAFLGCGSKVIPQIRINHDVILGAGSTLISDVIETCTMVGSPAKKI